MTDTPDRIKLQRLSVKALGAEKFCGLDCRRFQLVQKLPSGKSTSVGEMWTTKAFIKNQALEDTVNNTFGAPYGHGQVVKVVLKASYKTLENAPFGKRDSYLKLKEFERANVSSQLFKIPKNFLRASSMEEFIFSTSGRMKKGDFDDLFRTRL